MASATKPALTAKGAEHIRQVAAAAATPPAPDAKTKPITFTRKRPAS
jgi:hypothetical protein